MPLLLPTNRARSCSLASLISPSSLIAGASASSRLLLLLAIAIEQCLCTETHISVRLCLLRACFEEIAKMCYSVNDGLLVARLRGCAAPAGAGQRKCRTEFPRPVFLPPACGWVATHYSELIANVRYIVAMPLNPISCTPCRRKKRKVRLILLFSQLGSLRP